MTALAANLLRPHKVHPAAHNIAPVNAGSKIYVGAYICREAATAVAVPGTFTAGMIPLGVAVAQHQPDDPDLSISAAYDNTNGADGVVTLDAAARAVKYDQAGEYDFAVLSGTPKAGATAWLIDDNTVAIADGGNGIVAGVFTRPGPKYGWYVDIGKRAALATPTIETLTLGVTAAGTVQGDATALTALGIVEVTTVGAGEGVKLPTATAGASIILFNRGANTLKIYPNTGAAIDAGAANAAYSLATVKSVILKATTALQWYTLPGA